jgi:hypothetical protein
MTATPSAEGARIAAVAAVFEEVRRLPDSEREARLAELARDRPDVAAEVRSLLRFTEEGECVLDRPIILRPIGAVVGRYRIVRSIGEGGMGHVFLAEQQEPFRREVALKLIKLGMDTRAVVRRFEAEREVLARMSHPGIAQILDAGVAPDGRPFFAMELVAGEPVTEWCRRTTATTDERLRLFLQVCAAVQHAHQKGVIHRDLKPGNILVAGPREAPQPKVIDFGVARALDADGQRRLTRTQDGPSPGTPAYMSPEQLTRGDDVDTRSDVFSLGVVLREIVADPPGDETGTHPAASMPRDLGAIVAKATELDRDRRYATVNALAEDVERFVRGLPVQARGPGALYIAAKFARRHTVALLAASSVLVAVAVVFALVVRDRDRTQRELVAATIERGRLAGAVGQLIEARRTLWEQYLADPESPHAQWALRELLTRYPSTWTVHRPGMGAAIVATAPGDRVLFAGIGVPPTLAERLTGDAVVQCERISTWGESQPTPHSASVSRDGRVAAVAYREGDVHVWSLETGRYLGCALHADAGPTAVAFLADGRLLMGGVEGVVQAVALDGFGPDLEQRRPTTTVVGRVPVEAGGIRVLRVHEPTGQVAAGTSNGLVMLWSRAGEEPRRLECHEQDVVALAFNADGGLLATGSSDRTAAIWTTRDASLIRRIESNNGTVRDMAFEPGGALYLLGWWRLDRLEPGAEQPVTVLPEGGWRLAMQPNGDAIVTHGPSSSVTRWRLEPDALFASLPVEPGWTVVAGAPSPAVAMVANGPRLRGVGGGGAPAWERAWPASVEAVRLADAAPRAVVMLANGQVWALDFDGGHPGVPRLVAEGCVPGDADPLAIDPQGRRVAFRADASSVHVASLHPGAPPPTLAVSSRASELLELSFTVDGSWVVAAYRDRLVRAVRLDGAGRPTLQCVDRATPATVFSLAPLAGGGYAAGAWDGRILIDRLDGAPPTELRGHAAVVGTLETHPAEPDLLLSASMDGTVRLWHLGLGREVQSLQPLGRAPVHSATFDASGTHVVARGAEGRTVVWPLRMADAFIRGNSPRR